MERTLYPRTGECTFFSSVHDTFSRLDHTFLSIQINKFKRTKIIPVMFSEHNCIKLEINNRRKFGTVTKVKIKQHLLKKQ